MSKASVPEHVSDRDRDIYALPAREGGIAIDNPAAGVADKHVDSKELTEATQRAILDGGRVPAGLDEDLRQARSSIKLRRSVEVHGRAGAVYGGGAACWEHAAKGDGDGQGERVFLCVFCQAI